MYLDERLRYLPAGLGADGRASLLARQLAAESEPVAALAGSVIPADVTRSLLAGLHAPLTAPPSGDPLRVLLIGDSIFTGTRAFLAQAERAHRRPLDVEHLNPGELTAAGLAMGHVLDAISRRPPHVIGLSLFSYEGVPAYPALLAQRLPSRPGSAYVQGLGRLVLGAVDSIREITDAPILVHNACGLPLDRLRRRVRWLPAQNRTRKQVIGELNDLVAAIAMMRENIILIDEAGLAAANGGLRACAAPVFRPDDVPDAVFHPARLEPVLARRSGLYREMGFSETSDGVWELGSRARVAAVPDWFSA